MQTVNQTIEIVSYITGEPRSRVNQFARALLDAGILPKSAGRDIKKIGADKLLPLLAAVAIAEKVHEAAAIAADFAALPMEGEDSSLADFFVTLLENESPWLSPTVEFAKTAAGCTATVTGHVVVDTDDVKDFVLPFWRSKSWGHFCKRSFTISAEGVDALRGLFNRDDIGGVHFRLAAGGAE